MSPDGLIEQILRYAAILKNPKELAVATPPQRRLFQLKLLNVVKSTRNLKTNIMAGIYRHTMLRTNFPI